MFWIKYRSSRAEKLEKNKGLPMKEKLQFSTVILAASLLGGCVNVDSEVSETPSVYWKAPQDSLPKRVIQPEDIKTDKIISPEAKQAEQSPTEKPKKQTVASGNTLTPAEKMQAGKPLMLDDLIDIALENNTQTRIYWFQAKSYAAQKGSAIAAYYPQVSVGAQVYRSKVRPSLGYGGFSIPIGSYYETGFGPSAEINWLLFDFGKREAQVESAQNALLAANFDYNQSIQDVVLNVALAYYQFYAACGSVESARLSLEEARTAYESARARFDQSVGNKQDMLNALANAKNAEYLLEEARSSVETARANIAQVLGVRVGPNFVVSEAAVVPTSPETSKKIDELVAKAMRSRQTLLASYAKLAKSASDVKVAERNFLPQIGAFGQFSYTDYSQDSRGHQDSYTGGFSLSWSIFEGFARKYALINAKVAERAQAQSLKAAEIQIISDIWNYYHKYTSSVKQVASATSAVEASMEAFTATKTAYENGVSNITEFLNAQSRLATARQQKVSAEASLSMSIAQLAHATGALSANTQADNPENLSSIPE